MPMITIRVLRVDAVTRTGPRGAFQAYCVTGSEGADWDMGTFQAQTTSDVAASLCERAKALDRTLSVLWKDGRYGREIVTLDLT